MFSDPVTAVMAMIMLCFGGMIVMFVFIIRSGAAHSDELREAFRKQQMVLADLERQVMEMNFALRRLSGADEGQASSGVRQAATGSASRLSAARAEDDLSSMLEAASKSGRKLDLGDTLLTPPSVARPLSEEYDPVTDPHLFDDAFGSRTSRRQRGEEGRVGTAGGKGRAPLSIRLDD